jgi:hypothetical protein
VSRRQVGGNQFFLAAEEVIQRGLGHSGPSDDPVDADRLDALGVEELVGRVKEALSG